MSRLASDDERASEVFDNMINQEPQTSVNEVTHSQSFVFPQTTLRAAMRVNVQILEPTWRQGELALFLDEAPATDRGLLLSGVKT